MRWIRLYFLLALGGGLFKAIQLGLASPTGRWDSWAIWNRAALFLYHQSPHQFSPELAHPDYPVLLPSLVALGWRLVGSTSPMVPLLVGVLFGVGTLALLFGALRRWSTPRIAMLLVSVLLVTQGFVAYSTAQYADVPLGFFILLANVCLLLFQREASHRTLWMLAAGLAAGAALHTKNEGALFVLVLLVYLGYDALRQGSIPWKPLLAFAAGLLPYALVYLFFKFTLAPPNDILSGAAESDLLGKILDPGRYVTIASYFVRYGGLKILLALLAAVLLLQHEDAKFALHPVWLQVVLLLLGYMAVYVITPKDLAWHLETSMQRLILHIWPLALLTLGLSLPPAQDSRAGADSA